MTRKDLFGIAYVSIWIIIWGTFGSLVDFAFLENNIYKTFSIGQLSTFFIAGLISCIAGFVLFTKVQGIFFKGES